MFKMLALFGQLPKNVLRILRVLTFNGESEAFINYTHVFIFFNCYWLAMFIRVPDEEVNIMNPNA